jgi:uncharacterized membrane protein
MSHRQVAADSAVRWVRDAARTLLANPAPFLAMGLVIAVAAMVPLFGALALAILGPALYAGIAIAAREQFAGRGAAFEQLFTGFRTPGRLPRLLMLCLPGLVAGLLVAMLLMMLVGSALVGAGVAATTDSGAVGVGLGAGGIVFMILALAIGIASYALVFFAMPRVMLEDIEPVAAMRDSLQACLANIGAFLLFIALLLGGAIALSLLLWWLPTVLAQLVAMAVLIPLASASLYFAYRDVYGDEAAGAGPGNEAGPPSIEV